MEFNGDDIPVLHRIQLSASVSDRPILSLQELAVNSILASRNCHRIIQLYDYCQNVAGQVSAASLAREFIFDKFAFFVERYFLSTQ